MAFAFHWTPVFGWLRRFPPGSSPLAYGLLPISAVEYFYAVGLLDVAYVRLTERKKIRGCRLPIRFILFSPKLKGDSQNTV